MLNDQFWACCVSSVGTSLRRKAVPSCTEVLLALADLSPEDQIGCNEAKNAGITVLSSRHRRESPTDSRIRDLEKENRRLLDENMRLHKELQQAKMKQEQLKTRHQNDVKREKERQQREKEEMKEVLRVAVSSIQSRGPHIDILPELTKEELRLLKSIE